MQAGKLNKRITIQQYSETIDDYGYSVKKWADLITVWAHVKNVNGKEFIKSNVALSEVSTSIRIRKRQGLDSSMRVIFNDNTYQIVAVLPDEETNDFLDLACKRWVEHESNS